MIKGALQLFKAQVSTLPYSTKFFKKQNFHGYIALTAFAEKVLWLWSPTI